MNYEELYQEYLGPSKELTEANKQVVRQIKAVNKDLNNGDLKSFDKDSRQLQNAIAAQADIMQKIQGFVDNFDRKAYFNNGDFTAQLLKLCENSGIDVQGEFPVYEMFPNRVRIDAENLEVTLDGKKIQCMRPSSLVKKIQANQERLMKISFNSSAFLNELAEAYDTALLKFKKQGEPHIYLSKLYKILVPMSRSRKEYDQQSFAFDLARLRASGIQTTKDGRKCDFGTSHDGKQSIRILNSYGVEEFLSTIQFYKP